MFYILWALVKKEFHQLFRDRRMLFVLFFFPIFLLIVFGYAINLDVQQIKLVVLDYDRSRFTRQFIQSITATEYFDFVKFLDSEKSIQKCIEDGTAQVVMVIPPDFSKKIIRGEEAKLQFLIDGVNGNTASIIFNYLQVLSSNPSIFNNIVSKSFSIKYNELIPFEIEPRFWFNPNLKSSLFLLPGLIGIIIILSSSISVALSIVKEKETNSIEQIYVSPISTLQFIIGKIIPFALTSFINSFLVLFLGSILFEVPIRGNFFEITFAIILYIYAALSMGIFVSSIAETQIFAFLFVVVLSVLPSMLLSGFIFPIESMPVLIQLLTNITPAKYFLEVIRGILLRGISFNYYWVNLLFLLIYGTIFVLMSIVVEKVKQRKL